MVLPTDPGHKAAREQVVLALEIVLEDLLTGICGVVLDTKKNLRKWAGLPPKDDPALAPEPEHKARKPVRIDPRLLEAEAASEDGEAASPRARGRPAPAAPPSAPRPAAAPVAVQAPAKAATPRLQPPDDLPGGRRGLNAWHRGYGNALLGKPSTSPWGPNPHGAASWLASCWSKGYAAAKGRA